MTEPKRSHAAKRTMLDAICGPAIGFTDRPPVLKGVDGGYAVRVIGQCMKPRYEPGWLVYIDPNRRLKAGRDVVVYRHGDPEGLIKRFVGWEDHELVLYQFNPTGTIRIPRDNVAMCNLIVGASHDG